MPIVLAIITRKIVVEREGWIQNRFKRFLTLRVASHLHRAASTMIEPSARVLHPHGKLSWVKWWRSVCYNLTNSKLGWYSHVFTLCRDYRCVLGECQMNDFDSLQII